MAIQRIARKFEVALTTSLPKIAYRETIMVNADVDYKHKKQSGGSGQYGHVLMRVAPSGADAGISFSSSVVGGNVPREYIPSVEKGSSQRGGARRVSRVPGGRHSTSSSTMQLTLGRLFGALRLR